MITYNVGSGQTYAGTPAGFNSAISDAVAAGNSEDREIVLHDAAGIDCSSSPISLSSLGLTAFGQLTIRAAAPVLGSRSAAWWSGSLPGFYGNPYGGHILTTGSGCSYLTIQDLQIYNTRTDTDSGRAINNTGAIIRVRNCILRADGASGSRRQAVYIVSGSKLHNNLIISAGSSNVVGIEHEYADTGAEIYGNTFVCVGSPSGSNNAALRYDGGSVAASVKGNAFIGYPTTLAHIGGTAPSLNYNVSTATISGGTGNVSGASAAACIENIASDARAKAGGPLANVVTDTSGWVSTDASGTARTSNSATAGAFELAATSGAALAGGAAGGGTASGTINLGSAPLAGGATGAGAAAADLSVSGGADALAGNATGAGTASGTINLGSAPLAGGATGSGVGAADLTAGSATAQITFGAGDEIVPTSGPNHGSVSGILLDVIRCSDGTKTEVSGHASNASGLLNNITGLYAGAYIVIVYLNGSRSSGAYGVIRKVAA